jgi:hypothetical protein
MPDGISLVVRSFDLVSLDAAAVEVCLVNAIFAWTERDG